jgi:hypothetical protein
MIPVFRIDCPTLDMSLQTTHSQTQLPNSTEPHLLETYAQPMDDPEPSSYAFARADALWENYSLSILGIPTIAPIPSSAMQDTTMPLRCCLPFCTTAISSDDDLILCRFNEILVITGPSSHVDGIVLSARVETSIKLHISFHPGSSIQFLKLPKTPSVHSDDPAPEQSLKFSLEVRTGPPVGLLFNLSVRNANYERTRRRGMWLISEPNPRPSPLIPENGTASIEFFIKCYAHASRSRPPRLPVSICFHLWLVPHISG